MKRLLPVALVAIASPALAEETRELDSHEHGVGELNIAIEGGTVAMELHAPGADIVGFEYEAESSEDRAAIDAAVATLARPLELFVMPAAAECTVVQASAALESEEEHDDHVGEHDHDEDHADDHDHDKEHDHDEEHAREANHTEFHAEYTLNCGNAGALSKVTFAYFGAFGNARELEVQIVTASGAQAFEVERNEPTLDLRGMF
ncbi:MAG: DUF2796 domain-containing protein [Boseongicola sp.]|nr:DUF2796 domain-containing protein [Boseongicola sp.]